MKRPCVPWNEAGSWPWAPGASAVAVGQASLRSGPLSKEMANEPNKAPTPQDRTAVFFETFAERVCGIDEILSRRVHRRGYLRGARKYGRRTMDSRLEETARVAGMCEQRGLGLVILTTYETYFPEPLVLDNPKRLMVTSDGERLFKPYQELPDRVTFEEVGELGLCPFNVRQTRHSTRSCCWRSASGRPPARFHVNGRSEPGLVWKLVDGPATATSARRSLRRRRGPTHP